MGSLKPFSYMFFIISFSYAVFFIISFSCASSHPSHVQHQEKEQQTKASLLSGGAPHVKIPPFPCFCRGRFHCCVELVDLARQTPTILVLCLDYAFVGSIPCKIFQNPATLQHWTPPPRLKVVLVPRYQNGRPLKSVRLSVKQCVLHDGEPTGGGPEHLSVMWAGQGLRSVQESQ